jgi:hypothetical protein
MSIWHDCLVEIYGEIVRRLDQSFLGLPLRDLGSDLRPPQIHVQRRFMLVLLASRRGKDTFAISRIPACYRRGECKPQA